MSEALYVALVIYLLLGATVSATALHDIWDRLESHSMHHLLLVFLAVTLFWPLILWPGRK